MGDVCVSLVSDEDSARISLALLGDDSAMDDLPLFSPAGAQAWLAYNERKSQPARGMGPKKRSRLAHGFRTVSETTWKPCASSESVFFWEKRSQQTWGQAAKRWRSCGGSGRSATNQFKTPTVKKRIRT